MTEYPIIVVTKPGLEIHFNGIGALGDLKCIVYDHEGSVIVRRSYNKSELKTLERGRAAGLSRIVVEGQARLINRFSHRAPGGGRGRINLGTFAPSIEQLSFSF